MENKSEENLFSEFYNSTRDLIADRLSSPFIFSFVITWLISNYKIIMVILTTQSESFVLDYKIQLIENFLNVRHGLIYPLIGACFYTFAYPFIDQEISKFTLKRKMAIRNDKNQIEKTQLRTAEEVKAIHLRHFKIEQEYKAEIENARTTENQLRAQIENLQGKNISTSVTSKSIFDELSKDQIDIIEYLGKIADSAQPAPTETEIQKKLKLNITKNRYALEQLLNSGHIKRLTDELDNLVYELTGKGLNVYLELSTPP